MKVSTVVRQIIKALALSVARRQASALLILFAVMMPVAAPIPAWASNLEIPTQRVKPRVPLSPIENTSFTIEGFANRLRSSFSFFGHDGDKVEKDSAPPKSAARFEEDAGKKRVDSSVIPDGGNDTAKDPGISNSKSDAPDDNETSGEEVELEPHEAPEVEALSSSAPAPAAVLLDDSDEQAVRDSSYSGENNVGNPEGKFEADAPAQARTIPLKNRAGVGNFSFAVPIASLPGRGIDASIGMTYNSRVWNTTQTASGNIYSYNVDKNWIAPGFTVGYGSLTSHFEARTIRMNNGDLKTYNTVVPDGYTDLDGTRHQLEPILRARIAGTEQAADAGVNNYYYPEYGTKDGTFVRVLPNVYSPITAYHAPDNTYYAYATFTLAHADGTRVTYNVPGSQFGSTAYSRDHYPTNITDANGNQIGVAYLNGSDRIQYIRDTVGRDIKFYYDDPTSATAKLVAVTVPGFGGVGERQTIRFYYEDDVALASQGRFNGTVVAPATYRALRYVYFPASHSGYRYDYHSLGMISKITKLMGMTVSSTSTSVTGTISSSDLATTASTSEYTYVSDGSSTPLTDVPKFNLRTDIWKGPTSNQTSATSYNSVEETSGSTTTTVSVTDGGTTISYITKTDPGTGYTNETTVEQTGTGQLSSQLAKTKYFWDIKSSANNPMRSYFTYLKKVEVTNDAKPTPQTRATEFDVDFYNNTTLVRECEIAAPGSNCTELRRTETSYVTGEGWMNNNLIRLPDTVVTTVNNTAVAKTQFFYDENSSLPATPGVVQHDPAYNPNQGTHSEWHWECDGQVSPPRCPDGTPADHIEVQVPNNDPRYDFRGNLTKVTSYADAAASSDPSVKAMEYDMTGNVIKASMSCCNVKSIEYSVDNQYAYPTKETKGPVGTQLVTWTVYDKSTGLTTSTIDENNLTTGYIYDSATLRPTRVNYPDGAWTETNVNDTQFPYYVETTSSLDAGRSVSSRSFFDGSGRAYSTRSLTATGYLSSDQEFDSLGRVKKTFNPYTVAAFGTSRPPDTKFTEATGVDGLGRVTETTLPDGTKVNSYPNEATVSYTSPWGQSILGTASRVKDQAGKERRQIVDGLGRIVRVDEPIDNPPGGDALGSVTSPHQPTYFAYDGNDNLSKVSQSDGTTTQQRVFVYDSLSRLLRERQVEARATLDDAGNHGAESESKWTGVYKYTSDGLLDFGIDARGVKTGFHYDPLNRVDKVEYFNETGIKTPTVIYAYDEGRPADPVLGNFYNNGRLTTVSTQEINDSTTGQFTPQTIQKYDYDEVGQVERHAHTIDQTTYNLQYGYNLAGQLTSEKYPSGKTVTMSVDNFGVVQSVADGQRTYLSGVTASYDANGMTSQITLGNGTVETARLNERFQLTSQTLKRGTEVLQKFDYGYGQIDGSGNLQVSKNNGQLAQIESFIGAAKQRTQKFSYDAIGRLSKSEEYRGDTNALTYKQVFNFDRFGNLYRKAASNPTTGQQNPIAFTPIEEATTPGTGDIDKATNKFRTNTTYDDAGQVTQDDKFRSMGFAYDANGRVVNATKANTPDAQTVYDALGNRVATKINGVWQYMIYDAFGQLVAEYGTPSEGTGGVKYVQQDHQGSVRAITNESGFVVSRTDHQAFGDTIGASVGLRNTSQGYGADTSTRQGYGLTESDASSGQQHTWFRKLETQAGRWSSPDPYNGSMSIGNPQSLNRYSYVGNQPANMIDPSGLLPRCQDGQNPIDPETGQVVCEVRMSNYTVTISGGWGPDLTLSSFNGVGLTGRVLAGGGGGSSRGSNRASSGGDPCAGQKGKIDPNAAAYPAAGIDHVSDRHIAPQTPNWAGKKSVFEFGLLFTKGAASVTKSQRKDIVMGMFQDTFENGAANRLGGGDYAYSYAPRVDLVPGVAMIDFVGRDARRNGDTTNVRTVVLDVSDCSKPKLSTGYPGLARPNDRVNGVPTWVGNTWTLPF
jgi:RHS repeat-associated protein